MTSRKAKIQNLIDSDFGEKKTPAKKRSGVEAKAVKEEIDTKATEQPKAAPKPTAKKTTTTNRRKPTIKEKSEQETIQFEQANSPKPRRSVSRTSPALEKQEEKGAAVQEPTTDTKKPKAGNGRKRSDNRQVLVAADKESGKIQGIFLDAGHAAFILGLKVTDIKSDTNKGTKKTKLAWLKVPAGATLDQKEIERDAKLAFKEWSITGGVPPKKKPGRKPAHVDSNELNKMIKQTDLNKLDHKTMRRLKNLLAKASSDKSEASKK
jgi:hypothetical protein